MYNVPIRRDKEKHLLNTKDFWDSFEKNVLDFLQNQNILPFQKSSLDTIKEHFDEIFGDLGFYHSPEAKYPKIDVFEDKDNNFIVQIAVPGINKEDISLELKQEGGGYYLKVSGNSSEEYESKEEDQFYIRELKKSKFLRMIKIPSYIEGDPETEHKNGIIKLKWKTNKQKPINSNVKKIELK